MSMAVIDYLIIVCQMFRLGCLSRYVLGYGHDVVKLDMLTTKPNRDNLLIVSHKTTDTQYYYVKMKINK